MTERTGRCEYAVLQMGNTVCRNYFEDGQKCKKGYEYSGKINLEGETLRSGGLVGGLEQPDILKWANLCPVDGFIPASQVKKLKKK